jgi:translation initiation factor IF-2
VNLSNPKVFEFAKEVGLTPLALMDKIREWQLPVKSHMAELEPEVLAAIKAKLSEGKAPAEPKKVTVKKAATAKKAPVKKEEGPAPVAASATRVVRRKTAAEAAAAAAESSAEVEAPEVEAQPAEVSAPKVVRKKPAVAEEEVSAPEHHEPEVLAKTEAPVPAVEAKVEKVAVEVETPAATVTPVATKSAPATDGKSAAAADSGPARKKEVVVGQSGHASNATPANLSARRNIVGRMDLSRVAQNAPGQRPGGQGGAPGGPGGRPGGFSGPRGPGAGPRPAGGMSTGPGSTGTGFAQNRSNPRNLRTGFVAQSVPDVMPGEEDRRSKFEDKRRKAKDVNEPGAAGAKLGEGENFVFNATEFRKREMVFQPKKKKGLLNRDSMKTQLTTPKASKRIVKVENVMKLSDLAQTMGLKAPQLTKVLMSNGVMANMNTELDFDTIALIVPDFGWEAVNVYKTDSELVQEYAFGDLDAEKVTRPPVVTIMGHVDHGKTSLLDAIRKANVAAGEAGGITQHIGAYNVTLEDGSKITFLDTPGHEAFTAMRARGANVTDIAVIVVAADDGMMPQTQEAVNHAKAAGVPIIVAVNKMDKPGANPDKIKQQLTELELVPEEWGGTTIYCPVSAIKKEGIKELLEQIALTAEILELKANPKRSGTGTVIESRLEKGRGPVATLLVSDGTVSIGQNIVAGSMRGRVKSLTNDRGERIETALPGTPVEVLGLEGVPAAGDTFDVVKDEAMAEEVIRVRKEKTDKAAAVKSKVSLEDIFAKATRGDVKELPVILKSDVAGSLEAIQGMFKKLETKEVKIKIVHAAVGGITESDVLLATTAKGLIIGFNVRPDGGATNASKRNGIEIRTYSIVYELIDEMKKAMAGLLAPDIVEKVMGRAEVRNTFVVPKIGTIAGCAVVDGKVQRSNMIRLIRDGKIVYEGKISSLKRFKDDAKEVATGYECGIGIENFNDIKVGDVMEAFVKEEITRELTPMEPEAGV